LLAGNDEQLAWITRASAGDAKEANVRIAIEAESNTRSPHGIDPARQAVFARSRSGLRDLTMERAAAGRELPAVVTRFPTNASAQDAGDVARRLRGLRLPRRASSREDPVRSGSALGEELGRLAEWLGTKKELACVTEGTDLTVGVEGRTWIPATARRTSLTARSSPALSRRASTGHVRFSFPAPHAGRLVRDIELRFEAGEVVEARASEGEDFLREMLAMDDGARRLGEFAFGMNDSVQEFTGHTLFDEKLGGTVHMALGKAYPEAAGRTSPRCTGISSAICAARARCTRTASSSTAMALPARPFLIALLGDTHLPRGARSLPADCLRILEAADAVVHTGDFTAASVLADLAGSGR
jgi:aminopeptidase